MRVAMLKAVLPLLVLLGAWMPAPGVAAPLARHVVVIGLDGCRPELLRDHSRGPLRELWTAGAYSWRAEATVPSVTQVNFAGILTACVPAKHGIDQLAWNPNPPPRVKVTTIFDVLATHGRPAVALLGHEKLYPVETPRATAAGVHFLHSPHGAKAAAPLAAEHLRRLQPAFTFVYFGDLDGVGHRAGWLSPEQVETMRTIDDGVAQVFAAIQSTAMKDHTIVIVTSDHGGRGKSHSAATPEDRTLPWVIWGPGVQPGELPATERPIWNYDTAATALHVLDLPRPAEWDGRAITEAFRPR